MEETRGHHGPNRAQGLGRLYPQADENLSQNVRSLLFLKNLSCQKLYYLPFVYYVSQLINVTINAQNSLSQSQVAPFEIRTRKVDVKLKI